MKKLCVYPADVSAITGLSLRAAQKKIQEIKRSLNRKKYQCITMNELADYLGLDRSLLP